MQNVTFSIGNLALIEKADGRLRFFDRVFNGIGGKARDFIPHVKRLMYNRLGECVSVSFTKTNPHFPQDIWGGGKWVLGRRRNGFS